MIAEIRDYIRQRILAADPELKENNSAFFDGDIGESLIDRSFQITIGNSRLSTRDSHHERKIQCQVAIFGFGYRAQVENYDYLLERAVCIEDTILSLQNFSRIATITNIESSGIVPEKLQSNDDAFKITINLTLTQAYIRE